jgi:signal transduction histidine kinase
MKSFSLFICLSIISFYSRAQTNAVDSLREIINKQKGDPAEVDAITHLGMEQSSEFDSGIKYAEQALLLTEKINYKRGTADCHLVFGSTHGIRGNFSQAIEQLLNALNIYTEIGDDVGIASANLLLQGTYRDAGEYRKSLSHALQGERVADAKKVTGDLVFPGHHLAPLFLAEIGQTYVVMNRTDSALFYTQKAIEQKETFNGAEWNFPIYLLATIQTQVGDYHQAQKNFHLSVELARQNEVERDVLQNFSGLSTMFKKAGVPDSAIYYAQIVAHSTLPDLETKNLQEALNNLAELYQKADNKDSAIKYILRSNYLRDSMYSNEKDRQLQNITFNERLKQQQIEAEQARFKSRAQLYTMGAGLFVVLLVALLLWRNNLHKQKSKLEIEKAYNELKATQAQLIQSEKMASLGELTAGIAHEIQNPLNFVNNFSEVNNELIEELKMKNEKLKIGDNEVNDLLNNLYQNNEKISVHGKRADSIVKGMLQHSRTSSGQKELTDINELVDEYLRLAYHGLRAKDKSFNAKFETHFDPSIGEINIVPQDFGRVLLNLINNAFYAVSEKARLGAASYQPLVVASTKRINDKVEIKVKDNGNGIPDSIKEKIFQPFFTTKPTGQGTGLGLSLSYDIVKAHGGELKVNTKEGEESEFIIQLPA